MTLAAAPWVIPSSPGATQTSVWSANGDHLICVCNSSNLSLEQNRAHAKAIAALPRIATALVTLMEIARGFKAFDPDGDMYTAIDAAEQALRDGGL